MPKTLYERYVFSDADKAKAFAPEAHNGKLTFMLNLIAEGWHPRKVTDKPYACKSCKKELKWLITDTKTWGQIAIVPNLCNECRQAL